MKTCLFSLSVVTILASGLSQGATEGVHVREATLFKNGLGYFLCEIATPDKQDSFAVTAQAGAANFINPCLALCAIYNYTRKLPAGLKTAKKEFTATRQAVIICPSKNLIRL